MTSSFAAIGYGWPQSDHVFDEKDWTESSNPGVNAYQKSKTIAERAAWDFIKNDGGSLELSVINPVAIFGPLLGTDIAASIYIIKRLLNAEMPGCPQLCFGVVDVRDCADIHLLAMTNPKAAGERFLAASPPEISMAEMSKTLHERMPEAAKKAPTRVVPNFVIRIVALWDSQVSMIVSDLGKRKKLTSEKARTVLGWQPRSAADAIQATAESLIEFGLVQKP
jgi:dihydroflavonol-4-reductase